MLPKIQMKIEEKNICKFRSTCILNTYHFVFLLPPEFLFYRTTSSLKTHFFVNRIIDPITGDVMNIVLL
jgi:hypothetical protein